MNLERCLVDQNTESTTSREVQTKRCSFLTSIGERDFIQEVLLPNVNQKIGALPEKLNSKTSSELQLPKVNQTRQQTLTIYLSIEFDMGVADIILALNQSNLQTAGLGIKSCKSVVVYCLMQKCLWNLMFCKRRYMQCKTNMALTI